MVRTQIQLTAEQSKRIKQAAGRAGVSAAELIRRGVDKVLAEIGEQSPDELVKRARSAIGRHSSDGGNAAVDHDRYLSEAFGDDVC